MTFGTNEWRRLYAELIANLFFIFVIIMKSTFAIEKLFFSL